eukprot:10464019-Ditylum_brightwellii.AAC.1
MANVLKTFAKNKKIAPSSKEEEEEEVKKKRKREKIMMTKKKTMEEKRRFSKTRMGAKTKQDNKYDDCG